MTIPMCWKCASRIVEPDPTGVAQILIGCKDHPNIESYGGACILCPLIQPKEVKHDSRIREGQGN